MLTVPQPCEQYQILAERRHLATPWYVERLKARYTEGTSTYATSSLDRLACVGTGNKYPAISRSSNLFKRVMLNVRSLQFK